MKVSVIVVAAMVITSVNAGLWNSTMDWFRGNGGRSTTALVEGSSSNGQSEAAIKGRICNYLQHILGELWDRANDLEAGLHDQLPEYLNLMKGIGENGRRIKKSQLGPKQKAGYLALNGRNRTIFTTFDEEYSGVIEDYGMTQGEFSRKKCPPESLGVLSLEEMIYHGHFLQLPDADGVIVFGEQ
ncbi:hypothetical protein BASA61_002338 [Batrachochytrium salamandrivorans]|nr:hypothetical protein BASA62_008218 [Batrachochytrium salamandrivorans]KAH6600191.1 hypothetical protein BASA61_002338 [Batrachochytrium salamandrivorans]KAH9268057.1 hypothetical protein BASA83_009563 [Batrachochytrium salamandrivorans]